VKGKYQGFEGRKVKLGECQLEKAFADPAVPIRSTDLAKDLLTSVQYMYRYVVLDGKVVEGPPAERKKNVFFLEGYQKAGSPPLTVLVKGGDAQVDAIQGLKVGDTVRVKGKVLRRSEELVTVEFFAWMK
jgi:hypothetical protein